MSFSLSRLAVPRTTTPLFRSTATRSLATTSRRLALNENDKDQDDIKEKIDAAKHDQLEKARKHGKGEYKQELSSSSEDAVKADRGDHESDHKDMADLQRQTKDHAEKKHS